MATKMVSTRTVSLPLVSRSRILIHELTAYHEARPPPRGAVVLGDLGAPDAPVAGDGLAPARRSGRSGRLRLAFLLLSAEGRSRRSAGHPNGEETHQHGGRGSRGRRGNEGPREDQRVSRLRSGDSGGDGGGEEAEAEVTENRRS